MAAATHRYGECSACGALNMAHRDSCYRCRAPLTPTEPSPLPPGRPYAGRGPAAAGSLNRRKWPRKRVTICNVQVDAEGVVPHRATVRDLSPAGLCLHTQLIIRPDTRVSVELPLEGRVHVLNGTVRYVCLLRSEVGRSYLCGVQFDGVSPLLHRLVARL